MKKIYSFIIILCILAAGAAIYYFWKASAARSTDVTIEPVRIVDLRPVVKLCTVEISEDIPVKGQIGRKHLFARQTLNGSISFDLESMRQEWRGDTLIVLLPEEKVEAFESTEPESYKVIDTWNETILGSANFTTAEENALKEKAREDWIARLYAKGVVDNARRDAVARLRGMLPNLARGKTVIVIDTIPPASLRLRTGSKK